jgi:tetratricopeptide (TPR) repeat protein
MNFIFRRDAYAFVQLLSFLMPLTGYLIDIAYQTSPLGFIICTIAGIILFIWAYVQHKKTEGKEDSRAIDWITKGCTLQITGSHREAIIAFTRARELEPGTALTYFALGRSYFELGSMGQAIQDFNRAIELNPTFIEAYDKRGLCHEGLGNHEQAIKDFDSAIEINPKYALAYHNRSGAYKMLGNPEQSMRDAEAAARLGYQGAQHILNSKCVE